MSAPDAGFTDRLAAVLEAAGDLAYVWELDGDAIAWSGRLGGTGIAFSAEITTSRLYAGRIHPDDLVQRQLLLAAHFDGEPEFDCEYRLRDAAGGFAWVHERGRAVRDVAGRATQMLGVIRAVGDPKAQQSRVEQLASYDELTGHFNRTRLREAVDRIITAGQRSPSPAVFLAIGVDNMTTINDVFGAAAADTVLIEIGRRLDSCVRASDLVGRLGGDRFGIVLAHCPVENVPVAAEKILAAIRAAPAPTERGSVYATVSIGGASFPQQGLTSYDVITRAETAMAEAKRAGRDCYLHYRTGEEQRARQRRFRSISDMVQAALREDRMALAYQPIISATTGEVDYYECLLRLRDAEGGIIAAGEFVPVIEQLGLIRLVDRYVLDRTIAEIAAYPGITLGFNISGLTAADRAWLRSLTSQLRARPELAGRLVVEITETAALYDIEELTRFVSALRDAGCRVALDDFGVGHTSLRHLQSLALDIVKIDGSFVRNIGASADSQVFLRHLLGLAQGFGFRTVAEGVETEEEDAILRAQGIGYVQGFHCGRPTLAPPWREAASPSAAAGG